MTTVESSNELFNEVLCRSAADLAMLMTDTPQGRYPYAGIPWYSTTFGRDGMITALQMLWCDPGIARGVLRRLAALQAKDDRSAGGRAARQDPARDARRRDGDARRGAVPALLRQRRFDAAVRAARRAYLERTGDWRRSSSCGRDRGGAAWIDGYGDADGDGFVEYYRATEQGLANQGWKDSHDAIFHADGRLAEGPIALAEVQGYVYAAKQVAARCARRLGHDELATQLEAQAARLAERFDAAFWCPELESYALALDGEKEPCRVRTSNAGQVLFTGIAQPERAAQGRGRAARPQFLLRLGHPHRGERRGALQSDVLSQRLDLAARQRADRARLRALRPEAPRSTQCSRACSRPRPTWTCGGCRSCSAASSASAGRGPTLYPVACSPQAWASATPFALLEASLGLEFDPQTNEIRLRNPRLPAFLDEVMLRNLQLGGASVDLRVRRHGDEVSLEIVRSRGKMQVSIVLSA